MGQESQDYEWGGGQTMGQESQDYGWGGQTMGNGFEFGQEMGQEAGDYEDFGQGEFDFGQESGGFDFEQEAQDTDDIPDFLKPAFDTDSLNSGSLTLEEYEIKRKEAESIVLTDAVYGIKVEYTCKPGYKLIGEEQSTCTETGDWSNPQPLCYEQFCVDLGTIENGWMVYQGSGVNSRVEYNCNAGYEIHGEFERICQQDKSWTNEAPTCELVDCGEPEKIANGTVEYTSTIYGGEATYDCNDGFVLEGSVDRHCSIMGWNNTLARCVSIVCPTPNTIENGYIEYDGELEVTSIVKYECKECFDLDGPESRTCLVDGTWTLDDPFCNIKLCDPVPDFFENGKIIGNDNSCDSKIEYECNPGYKLKGKRVATCKDNKRWSHRYPPVCEPISCGVPDDLPNGRYSGSSFSFTDKLIYECNSCFTLSGPSIRVCQSDGTWSEESPVCKEITCRKPPLPTNGKVRLSGMDCGDDAKVVCDPGYRLDGAQFLKCGTDGNWDNEIPFCWPVICPTAPHPEYAFFNSTEINFEAFSVLKYECEVGYYTTLNDTRLFCSADGDWEGTVISCYPVNCGAPATLTNGRIIGGTYTFEGIVNFECEDGYELLGDPKAECLADGMWSNNVTTCSQILCPAPMQLTNGKIITSDPDNSYGASIQYQCNVGHIMSGDSILTCDENGQWQGTKPSCQPVTCPEPYEVFASTRKGVNYEFNNSLVYNCDTGYQLVGSESIICQADGTWSDDFPFCDLILCLPIAPIYHGSWEQVNIHGIPMKTEPDQNGKYVGHTKVSKSAKIMEQIIDEFPEEFDHKYGDMVRFSCDKGYELSSEELSTCTEVGWSIAAPRCDPVRCPIPIPIQHGSVKGSEDRYDYGTTITYECKDGYDLIGESTRTCTENKTYSGEAPFCKIKNCPIPEVLENGQTIGSNYTYKSILSYACIAGFKLEGIDSRTCESNGMWSAEMPVCIEIFCSLPSEVSNGVMDYNSLKVGSTARYTCLEGFRMEGLSVLNCLDDGDWDASVPSCVQVDCGPAPNNDQLVLSGEHTIYNSKVMYSCERGFRLVGPQSSTCLQSGIWSRGAPTCELVSCPQPPRLNHGTFVKKEGRYTIVEVIRPERLVILPTQSSKGHKGGKGRKGAKGAKGKTKNRPVPEKLIQAPKCIKCNWPLGQQYHPHPSDCTKFIHCSPLGPIEKDCAAGTRFDINLSICNHAATTPCNIGDYDTIDGYCGSASKESPILDNIISNVTSYVVDDEITWSCNEGYFLEGTATSNCTQEGTWSSSPPRCRRVSCGVPELPDYSVVNGGDFLYGGNITYKCRDGYNLQGEAVLTCAANGTWSPYYPKCVPVTCGPPSLPSHVTAAYVIPEHGIKNAFGTSVTFNCVEGYEIMGGKYQICENEGLWVGSEPKCVERLCGLAPVVNNSIVHKNDSVRPQTARYTCLPGYEFIGKDTITCQLGKWTNANFTCTPLNCYEPTIPRMGKITAKSFTFSSIANYSCIYGYTLHGNPSVECGLDGSWIGDIPECLPVDCGEPEVPENGNVESDHTDLNASALYYCNQGYQIYGNDTRVCSGDGKWSGDFPQCLKKDCGELQPPQNGYVLGVGTVYGDRVKFVCESGYELDGADGASCLNTGNWSAEVPLCQSVSCGPPIFPPNTQEQNASFVYPERLVLRCLDGHIPRGDLSTTCGADGKWTRVQGQCSKLSCGRPKLNNDGSIIIGRSFYYNDRVIFRCPPGKKLNGSPVVSCTGDGEWSSIPSCTGTCGKKCLNGGVCLTRNKCACPPGFVGDRCQRALCPFSCKNGGVCTGPHRCTCLPGYRGRRCQRPVCEQGCGKGGRCIGPNVCHCNKGYSGSACEIEEPDYYYDYIQQYEGETNANDWDLVSLRRRENGYQRLNV
ncbi:unnamed protein product [Meganyctiphanes norvegica]|uniref:Sushi, von Willebrand factor type A, EGF and pentraxin domain-containing protein 1 n=1 Tax=Meganyctiphanes norvegica TaxID=48144 RepID=A0AAV2RRH4_MEGNR